MNAYVWIGLIIWLAALVRAVFHFSSQRSRRKKEEEKLFQRYSSFANSALVSNNSYSGNWNIAAAAQSIANRPGHSMQQQMSYSQQQHIHALQQMMNIDLDPYYNKPWKLTSIMRRYE